MNQYFWVGVLVGVIGVICLLAALAPIPLALLLFNLPGMH